MAAMCAASRSKLGQRPKRGSPRCSNSRPITGRAPNGMPTAGIASRACWTACEAKGKASTGESIFHALATELPCQFDDVEKRNVHVVEKHQHLNNLKIFLVSIETYRSCMKESARITIDKIILLGHSN